MLGGVQLGDLTVGLMRRTVLIFGICFSVPITILVLWTLWNLRHYSFSVLLIVAAVGLALGASAWSFRARTRVAVLISGTTLLVTTLVANAVTTELGAFTAWLMFLFSSMTLISGLVLVLNLVRALIGIGSTTRQVLGVVGALVSAFVLLGVVASIYSTTRHYTGWYFMLPISRVTVRGARNSGYIHWAEVGGFGTDVIVTRRHSWWGETYWIVQPVGHKPSVKRCSDWTAPRFPVFAIGDVNPPCMFAFEDNRPQPPERNLTAGLRFVEFTADDGERIRAEW